MALESMVRRALRAIRALELRRDGKFRKPVPPHRQRAAVLLLMSTAAVPSVRARGDLRLGDYRAPLMASRRRQGSATAAPLLSTLPYTRRGGFSLLQLRLMTISPAQCRVARAPIDMYQLARVCRAI
jgi:hypothetical protein